MALYAIDGALFKRMILTGASMLEKNKQEIDALNVFPVPDGDTGTNMSLTMLSAARELAPLLNGASASDVAAAAARGALKGARGNSGVILSQLFRGIARALEGHAEIDGRALAESLQAAVESAYKAVMKPKEGTILTVAKAVAESAAKDAVHGAGVYEILTGLLEQGDFVLKKTPEMLPVLKAAGVVDAGGAGLLLILHGFKMAADGEEAMEGELAQRISALQDQGRPDVSFDEDSGIEFGYCTETFIKNLADRDPSSAILRLREELSAIGDCVLVVGDEDLVKVHVHSNEPGRALQYCLNLGELSSVKIDNMREQHRNIIEEAAEFHQPKAPKITKDRGFVAVGAGEGIEALFKDLGADETVLGGQTMNPSAADIAEAVERTGARVVYVLPNNKNIVLAAEQAKELVAGREIHVVPTSSVPQGVAAMIAFVPDVD
ncbi:MAG: DAK2 domain-containing protein, partial [Christensenellaceae bacterium]|nr:DAK2 domain-containing protein [Christensenellaceae bacterium]